MSKSLVGDRIMNIGWECPKCHICYAPSVTKCECSVVKKDTEIKDNKTSKDVEQLLDKFVTSPLERYLGYPNPHHPIGSTLLSGWVKMEIK